MIRRPSLRKILAPAAGLRKSGLVVFFGIALLFFGFALSFSGVIGPSLESLRKWAVDLMGSFVPVDSKESAAHLLAGAMLFLGLYVTFLGVRTAYRQINETINPNLKSGVLNEFVRRKQLAEGPEIVAMGGGTGLSTLLRGLKQYSSNITAVVTVTDDGGSSGKLIQEKGMIPPGDIRNCLVALADAEKAMTDLFQHRFKDDSGSLSGHSIGNLLLAAMLDQNKGDFEQAIQRASEVLNIRGRVTPSTLDHVGLRAILDDGREVCGETNIANAGGKINKIFLDPMDVVGNKMAIAAIIEADIVVIGPGSVFTSVIPNLLVPGMVDALRQSEAIKVYVCNIMTQPGESEGFSASQHVTAILRSVEARIFDYVMVNTGLPSEETLARYRESGQHLVDADIDLVRGLGYKVITGDFMSSTDFVRHDPARIAGRLMTLLEQR